MDELATARRAFRYFKELLRFSDPTTLSSSFPRFSFNDFSDLFAEQLFEDDERNRVMMAFFRRDNDPEHAEGAAPAGSSGEAPGGDGDNVSVAPEEGDENGDVGEPLMQVPVYLCVCSKGAASEGHWESEEHFETCVDPKAKKLNIHFVIPATLLRGGSLERPSPLAIPTFPPDALEPQPHDATRDVVGTYDDYRNAINELIVGRVFESFADYLEAALQVYRRVTGRTLRLGQGYRLVVVADQISPMTKLLHTAYDALAKVTTLPPILGRIFATQEMDRQPLAGQNLHNAREKHVAMVDRNKDGRRQIYALDPSQRLALHRHIQLGGAPGLIAVNGPPGTGKTDMLRAIIANLWVTAAIEQAPCPVIVACGATNQSVENVMSAFAGAPDPYPDLPSDAHIENRWIVGVTDYGFASPSRPTGKIGKFQLIKFSKREPMSVRNAMPSGHKPNAELRIGYKRPSHILMHDFIARYAAAMKDSEVQSALTAPSVGAPENIEALLGKVKNRLHQALIGNVEATNALRRCLLESFARRDEAILKRHLAIEGAPTSVVDEVRGAFSGGRDAFESACENLLDVTTRPASFHIAARYWEAEWLATSVQDEGSHLQQLRRLSMLGPCIVSTLHSAPKVAGSPLPFGKIDMIIVDEAGQGAVELGIPALSFARQAIVVGDIKQLSPIVQITDLLDSKLATEFGLTMEWLSERRLNGSDSSIMAFAARASSFGEGARDGLLLRNHYRCARTIIEFCRELMYNQDVPQKELQPVKKDYFLGSFYDELPEQCRDKVFPIPPMAFVQCGSILDEPMRTESWRNDGEKRRILEWIDTDGRKLLGWYRKNVDPEADFKDVIAIITPFRAQATALREAINELLGTGHRITIGTVHTLQGAEKPVVLFSAVSKPLESGKDVFFDKDGGRLLNVAVSRARDAFILFGHSDLFFSEKVLTGENASRKPSELLGRYLAGLCINEHDGSRGTKILPRAVVIVESDHKAREIEKMLPKEFQVFGTGGHIRDIPFCSIREENGFSPPWELSSGALDRLKLIGTRLLQTPHLIIATDPDEQGEAIGWHVLQVLKEHPNFKRYVQTVSRVLFTEIEESAIRRAFSRPLAVVDCRNGIPEDALAMNFVRAALAQRVVDNVVSGHLHRRHGVISGRVRAPLLRLIAGTVAEDQDQEVHPEVEVVFGHRSIPAHLISNSENGLVEALRNCAEATAMEYAGLESVDTLQLEPPRGLSTLDVLRAAFLRFGMLPGRTMNALQRLYEDRTTGDDPTVDRSIPLSENSGVAVQLFGGHLLPTKVGADVAALLRDKEPYITSLDFARDLEEHLDTIRSSYASYEECIEVWTEKISGSSMPAAPPEGPKQDVPFVYPDLPKVAPLSSATVDLFNVLAFLIPPTGEDTNAEDGRGLNLHPSLAPLAIPQTADVGSDLEDLPDHLKVHSILVGRLIASAMRPLRLRINHHAFVPTGLPDGYRVLVASYEVEEEGWLTGDSGARREIEAQFIRSDELPTLCAGKAAMRVIGVRQAGGLASSRIDRVLDFMSERDIGRPSTYASHIDALLRAESYSTFSRPSSNDENDAATNHSASVASRSMSR